MTWGQLVIGPAGSGKTTYCTGMYDFLTQLSRYVVVVNLDPAQESDPLPYPCKVDVRKLVNCQDIAEKEKLGPNGALLSAMDYLAMHTDWLISTLLEIEEFDKAYVLFDCPGQIELYIHHDGMKKIVAQICKQT